MIVDSFAWGVDWLEHGVHAVHEHTRPHQPHAYHRQPPQRTCHPTPKSINIIRYTFKSTKNTSIKARERVLPLVRAALGRVFCILACIYTHRDRAEQPNYHVACSSNKEVLQFGRRHLEKLFNYKII